MALLTIPSIGFLYYFYGNLITCLFSKIKIRLDGCERSLESALAAIHIHELKLRAGESHVRRQNPNVLILALEDNVLCGDGVYHHIICRLLERALVDAESARRVALRVDVREEDFIPLVADGRREVDRRGRLADAAFLIDYCNYLSQSEVSFAFFGQKYCKNYTITL